MQELADAVKRFRVIELGATQKKFAEMAGLSAPVVIRIEKGFRPSISTYGKLAEIMGMEPKALREMETKKGK